MKVASQNVLLARNNKILTLVNGAVPLLRQPRLGHVGSLMDKVKLGQVFSSTSVSLGNHYTHCYTLNVIHHPDLVE
jgi:hypothetical protein